MNKGKLYGVSLGPGEPDLITVKGLEVLKSVDKIYYPGSLYKDGSKLSYSKSILEHYNLDENKCIGFYLEMSLARTQAKDLYQKTFEKILIDIQQGFSVAVVAEGDISTFSSFSYVLEKAKQAKVPCELVPGITSYNLAASQYQIPLCLQNETVLILPRISSKEKLQEAIRAYDTVILMKIISVMDIIDEVIHNLDCQIIYSEKLGTQEEFQTSNWKEVQERKVPYFSLLIIKK